MLWIPLQDEELTILNEWAIKEKQGYPRHNMT